MTFDYWLAKTLELTQKISAVSERIGMDKQRCNNDGFARDIGERRMLEIMLFEHLKVQRPDVRPRELERKKRRTRSGMTKQQAHKAMATFAMNVNRMLETSDVSAFRAQNNLTPEGYRVLQFLVKGNFGDNDAVFEAIRVLAGWKLPRL